MLSRRTARKLGIFVDFQQKYNALLFKLWAICYNISKDKGKQLPDPFSPR